jgi:hypothetical protein
MKKKKITTIFNEKGKELKKLTRKN